MERVGVALVVLLALTAACTVDVQTRADQRDQRQSRQQRLDRESHRLSNGPRRLRRGDGGRRPDGVPDGAVSAVVSDHVDGDTIKLRAQHRGPGLPAGVKTTVRLLEIDTPESVKPGAPVECYAYRAATALARLAPFGARVWVLRDRELIDPYDRTLLYLWTDEGVFVNLALVRSGAARAVLYEPNDRYIDLLRGAEQSARRDGRGVWGACPYFGSPSRTNAG